MPILGNPRFSRTLPLSVFERLQALLQQMKSTIGEGAVVLTEDLLLSAAIAPEHLAERFVVVVSERFSALLLGEREEPQALVN